MAIVIGLDVGTSGTKALAVHDTGEILASSLVEYPLLTPRPDWAEQDPTEWKNAAYRSLSDLTRALGDKVCDVQAIGLTGQMHGAVLLDGHGAVLRNALIWCDQRTTQQCDAITSKVGAERLIEMVCNPALVSFTATKLLWVRDNEPHLYEKAKKLLLPKDYVRYVLTDTYATDVADASGTLLFDVKNRCWHRELMSILDIDPDMVPPAFEGPEVTGHLSQAAAERTGLPKGIPVVAGGGDQAAGGVGCGVVKSGVISSTIGTSGVVFAFSDTVQLDPGGSVQSFCHAVPGKWHVMGVVMSAGGCLRWYRDAMCQPEKAVAAETGVDPYAYITAAAETVPLGSEGLLFLPYLTGERTPHKDPYAKGSFVGFTLRHSKAHMARAVMEGVAFAMRDSLEIIRSLGVPIQQVRASGGGAKSAFWRSMQADVNNAPLVTINVDEGPSFGAALLAAVGIGLYSKVEEACDATIKVVDTCTPTTSQSARYNSWFREYQELYRSLAPGFRRTAKLLAEQA